VRTLSASEHATGAEAALLYLAVLAAFVNMYLPQAILPLLGREFGVSPSTASLSVSVMILGIAVSSLLVGPLSDRVGRKPLLVGCALALGGPSLVCALAPSWSVLLAGRFCQGLLIPGLTAVSVAYIAEEFPEKRVGRLLGGYVAATVTGGLLSRVLAGLVAEAAGWRWAFVLGAALAFAVGGALVRLRPSRHFVPSRALRGAYAGMLAHLRSPRLVGGFAVGFSLFFAFMAVFTYLPFYVEQPPFGFSPGEVGLLYLVYAAGVVSSPLAGALAVHVGPRGVMVLGLGTALVASGFTLLPSAPLLIAALLALCFGNFAAQSTATAFVATQAERDRAGASALYLFAYYLGGSLGAFVPGLAFARLGWSGVLLLSAAALLSGMTAAALLCRPRARAADA
jgi:YNFM family putative membrane transporter